MFIGHYAPALVLQRARPSIALWVLFVAVQVLDVVWAVFILRPKAILVKART